MLKGGLPTPIAAGDKGHLAEKSKELLRLCLKSVHELSRCYFYSISSDKSIPGSLSYLLDIEEGDLVGIFKICGFFNNKKGFFLQAAFRTWVASTFEARTVEVTSFRKKALIKIGLGNHPRRPTDQWKDNLDPPRFRMQTAAGPGKTSKDSLMSLFDKLSQTMNAATTTMTTTTTTTTTEIRQRQHQALLLLSRSTWTCPTRATAMGHFWSSQYLTSRTLIMSRYRRAKITTKSQSSYCVRVHRSFALVNPLTM